MSDDAPRWQPIWLICRSCAHEWDDWQPVNVRISIWVACIKVLDCPNCGVGAEAISIRSKPIGFVEEEP